MRVLEVWVFKGLSQGQEVTFLYSQTAAYFKNKTTTTTTNQLVKLNTSSPEMTQFPRLSFTTVAEQQIALVIVDKEKKHLNTTFYTAHVLHTYVKTPYSDSLQIC